MKFDHKLSPEERGMAIQELCEDNLDDIINIFAKHSAPVHDARALIHAVFKKHGVKNTDETDCFISEHVEETLNNMAQKSANDRDGFKYALSKKFLETSMFFAILAEAVHKIEKASI